MIPALHEYTKKYINIINSDGLREVTYSISGDLVEGLDIDSQTGIISGHPEKRGMYTYDVLMKHSKGEFRGVVTINVIENDKSVKEETEPEDIVSKFSNVNVPKYG